MVLKTLKLIKVYKILYLFFILLFIVLFIIYINVVNTHIEVVELRNTPLQARIHHNSSLLCNKNVLITGGKNPKNHMDLDTSEIFDSKVNSFITGPKMNLTHSNHEQITLPDCNVLIIDYNGIETYDYKLNKFVLWENDNIKYNKEYLRYEQLFHPGFAIIDDYRIAIVGGATKIDSKIINDKKIRILNTKHKKTEKILDMDMGRTSPGVIHLNNNLFIFGGLGNNKKNNYLASSISVNINNNKIEKLPKLIWPRYNFSPIKLPDNDKILLIGGTDMVPWSAFEFKSKKEKYHLGLDIYDIKKRDFIEKLNPYTYIVSNLHNMDLYNNSLHIISDCQLFEYNLKNNELKKLKNLGYRRCYYSNNSIFLSHNKILITGIKNEFNKEKTAIIIERRK